MTRKPIKTHPVTPEHEEAMADLRAILKKFEHLGPLDLLALASQMVGQLVAFQDQLVITPEMAMEVVGANIQAGNQAALETIINTQGEA